jgi:hypothetical protein
LYEVRVKSENEDENEEKVHMKLQNLRDLLMLFEDEVQEVEQVEVQEHEDEVLEDRKGYL